MVDGPVSRIVRDRFCRLSGLRPLPLEPYSIINLVVVGKSMRLITIILVFCTVSPCFAQREVVALDGQWDIADSKVADVVPTEFVHKVPVPGLAHSSTPGFPDLDAFSSRQLILNRIAT